MRQRWRRWERRRRRSFIRYAYLTVSRPFIYPAWHLWITARSVRLLQPARYACTRIAAGWLWRLWWITNVPCTFDTPARMHYVLYLFYVLNFIYISYLHFLFHFSTLIFINFNTDKLSYFFNYLGLFLIYQSKFCNFHKSIFKFYMYLIDKIIYVYINLFQSDVKLYVNRLNTEKYVIPYEYSQ